MRAPAEEATGEFRRGWPILLLGFAAVYCMNMLTYPTSVLVKPISAAWGWSRAETTAHVSFAALVTLTVGPWVGIPLRRAGPIRTALVGLVCMAAAMAAVGRAGPSLPLWYLAWTAVAVAQQFCTVIVWSYAASVLFVRHRGIALAIVISASALAAATMPPLTLWLYDRFGIASTYAAYAGIILLVAAPLPFVKFRRPPAPLGAIHHADEGLTLRQAVSTARFWLLSLGITAVAGVVAAVIFHAHALMTDAGLSVATATWVMSLLGPSLLVGRLGTGVLLDRLPARAIAGLTVLFPAITCVILATYSGSVALAAVAVLCCGLAAGAEGDILAYFAGRHFGMAHYGSIYGFMLGLFSIGFGSFPPLAGHVFDLTGSYSMAFWIFAGLLAVASVLLLGAGEYPDEYRGAGHD